VNDLTTAYYHLRLEAANLETKAQRSGMVAAERIRVARDATYRAAAIVAELQKENGDAG
jgi:hypothetical protein